MNSRVLASLIGILALCPIVLQPTVFAQETGTVCVDFENLPVGIQYPVGASFDEAGVMMSVEEFMDAGGGMVSGYAYVSTSNSAGHLGKELGTNNVNIRFQLDQCVDGASLYFGEYGGNVNLEINGDLRNVPSFFDLDGVFVGGVLVHANATGRATGILEMEGPITTLAIGGQELFIDHICFHICEDTEADLGDAPDGSNNFGVAMTAYPEEGPFVTPARYPTVYRTGSPPYGPIHLQPMAVAFLGGSVSMETEADIGPDSDGINNIVPPNDLADLDGFDDGVLFPLSLPHCQPTTFNYVVTVKDATLGPFYVNVWFDWNRDGDWNDTLQCPDGIAVPEWAVQNQVINFPATGSFQNTTPAFVSIHPPERPYSVWMRITLAEKPWPPITPGLVEGGAGPSVGYQWGETEDYKIADYEEDRWDFGDAPDRPYPTFAGNNGARHQITSNLFMGASVDPEPDGQPDPAAMGDDNDGNDDEDGVAWLGPIIAGQPAQLQITASASGRVDAWVDYNADGDWLDAGEKVLNNVAVNPGLNPFNVNIPAGAVIGHTFTRFRISSKGGLSPTGAAPDGEVEDGRIFIDQPPPDNAKWIQWPDLTPQGIDIRIDQDADNWRIIADDFECSFTSLLTDVHFWGSWFGDEKGEIQNIHLSVYSDDPVGPGGLDPENNYSKPDQLLWEADFNRDQFAESLYAEVPEGEWWWDPVNGQLIPAGDRMIWRYDIQIDPERAFRQEGSPDQPVIYWLAIHVKTEFGQFGWKTRRWPDHFMDDATFAIGDEMPPIFWEELRYPPGHPYSVLDVSSIDMSFMLTFEEPPPEEWDWGDAPAAAGYPTRSAQNGARHLISPNLFMGISIDPEPDGQPNPMALGDDNDGNDDEDGVIWPGPIIAGQPAQLHITASAPGRVDAWVDYNADGDWNDAGEKILNSVAVNPGLNPFNINIPAGAAIGHTFTRFRLSSTGGLNAGGAAPDGEVEDGRIFIEQPPPDNAKWIQWPDVTREGIDIRIDEEQERWRTVADDFLCTFPSLLTDVHFWGSWLNDDKGQILNIHLSIYTDDPVGPGGVDPDNQFSKPDQLLWEADFGPDQYVETLYTEVPEGEWWWNPASGDLIPAGDKMIWRYDIQIDPALAFRQKGTEEKPVIYWLAIRVKTDIGQFGWKTRRWPDHFMDDATFTVANEEFPPFWQELRYPAGHPFGQLIDASVDMAFILTFSDVPQEDWDWGDAPAAFGYPTLSAQNGARHLISPNLFMGAGVDPEPDGQPDPMALGDDNDGNDDEDGVVWPGPIIAGQPAQLEIRASAAGRVDAWVDYNADGDWNDAGEKILNGVAVNPGLNPFNINIPAGAAIGHTFTRFRLSSAGGLNAGGAAPDGEVEDGRIFIDQPPPDNAKWIQWPDLTTEGIDIRIDDAQERWRTVADDFLCSFPSLLTDLHFWGSWLNDDKGQVLNIHVSIFSDDPVGPGGVDPDNQYSKPEQLLWEADFGPGQFEESFHAEVPEGEWWWDPFSGELIPAGDRMIWRYDIQIPPDMAFRQEGTQDAPAIYWLAIRVKTDIGQFGWKTRRWPDHFMDDATFTAANEDLPLLWKELRYPIGHPYSETAQSSIDMAFILTFSDVPQEDWDWGDAPAALGYPTLAAQNGAHHMISPNLFMGVSVDPEPDGQPDPMALGDDNDGNDDEDGVIWPGPIIAGQPAQLEITASASGRVDAWVDYNADGDWQDAGEKILNSVAVNPGLNPFNINIPAGAAIGHTFTRFRLSSAGGLKPSGASPDGEVEDGRIFVDQPPPDNAKWIQWPDLTTEGIDIRIDEAQERWRTVADDFLCTFPSLLTDVHFWGSWLKDEKGEILNIHISIYSDDPVGPGGVDPDNQYSKPEQLLWEEDFGPGQFAESLHAEVPEGEWWWDPFSGELIPAGDRMIWRYDIQIPPDMAFRQEGTQDGPVIYWLAIRVKTDIGQFGWKTRRWPDHFMDDATFTAANEVPSLLWKELRYPPGHPYEQLEKSSIDMAFLLTFSDVPQEDWDWGDAPVIAGTAGYPTLASQNGARHLISPNLFMGASVDPEPDGQPEPMALGDDNDGNDDEDGVIWLGPMIVGQPVQFEVIASAPGRVDAWVDYNADSDWNDPGEKILSSVAVNPGINPFTTNIPLGAVAGPTFVRFRISSTGGLAPTGAAPDGEVEDGRVVITKEMPDIDIEKHVDGHDADVSPGPDLIVGESLEWEFIVTNTGDTVLNNVKVEDDKLGLVGTIAVLNKGETVRITVSGIVAAGLHTNIAEAEGTSPAGDVVTDSDPCHYRGIEVEMDFGDAPDPTYPTLRANQGARHVIDDQLKLGIRIDPEPDGQPDPAALGDDLNNQDDEDGVSWMTALVTGTIANVEVTASASGILHAWIDFNQDGHWQDPNERIFMNPVNAGVNPLQFQVPANAIIGETFARFRLSTLNVLGPEGFAPDGEIEDYRVEILEEFPPSDCIDFESLTLMGYYGVNASFVDNGVTMSVEPFQLSDGTWIDGVAFAGTQQKAGHVGKDLFLANANIEFHFGLCPESLSLYFGEYGGNVNLTINNNLANTPDFIDLDGTSLGGVQISVTPTGGGMGIIELQGLIEELLIGGQELYIDHVCPVYFESELHITDFYRSGSTDLVIEFVCAELPQPTFTVEKSPVVGSGEQWNAAPGAVITPMGCGYFKAIVPLSSTDDASFYRIKGVSPSPLR